MGGTVFSPVDPPAAPHPREHGAISGLACRLLEWSCHFYSPCVQLTVALPLVLPGWDVCTDPSPQCERPAGKQKLVYLG